MRLRHVIGELCRTERGEILEKYSQEWRDYEKTYATFSLAVKLREKTEQRDQATEKCQQAAHQLEAVQTQLKKAGTSAHQSNECLESALHANLWRLRLMNISPVY